MPCVVPQRLVDVELCALGLTSEYSEKSSPLIPDELAPLKLFPCHQLLYFSVCSCDLIMSYLCVISPSIDLVSVLPVSNLAMWPWNATRCIDVLGVNVYILYSTFIQTSEVLTRERPVNRSLFFI